MSRRIDIELTSHSGDGSWTWRAAGARQPKGVLSGDLVPEGEVVGSVFRAEVEIGLEGIEVQSLTSVKPARSPEKVEGRIEVKGTPKRAPDVSVILAPTTGKRRRRDDGESGEEHLDRKGASRSSGGGRGRSGPGGPAGPGGSGGGRGESRGEGAGRGDSRGEGGSGGGRSGGPGGSSGPRRPGTRRPGEDSRPGRGERPVTPTSTVHRNAMLATLRPEQIPVAEQLLRGGLPAVRQAIEAQNADAKISGKPPASTDALTGMAEELLPIVKLADWKDRASAAQTAGKEFRLRELRAVVAASRTVILDEEGRTLAKALHDSLDQRVTALRDEWLARITNAIKDGRILQALEAVMRPPEPGTRCPADLAVSLATAAGEAMTAETPPAEWIAILDAVVQSPVRRTVKPAGIPADELAQQVARHASGSVPALAKLLGLRIPPPPPRRVVSGHSFSPSGS
ncbi:MAG TPA: hypothetical protein VHV57_04520 [Acidimicrobiales bacterium]|jgi:hypothetical protein|nr:hypothetical protein [Acidimicrobiales bacterium]